MFIQSFFKKALYEIHYKYNFNWECEPPNYDDTDVGRTHAHLTYFYFMLKILDYLDTVSEKDQ